MRFRKKVDAAFKNNVSLLFAGLLFWATQSIFAQIETFITAYDGMEGDQFGHDVGLSDEYLVSGAPNDDNENGTDAGAVYIYKREGNQWVFQTKLLASDGSDQELFGYSVDIDGELIIVGCPWDDDAGEKSGAAFIFKLEEGNWVEKAKLRADDASEDDRLGICVKISGETVAVGAFFDDVVGNRSGSAYVFVLEGTTWIQQAKLLPSDGATDDWFGVTLSLHTNDVAITSRRHDALGSNSGAVYVFNRSGETWTEQAKITAYDGETNDEFGTPCIFGSTLIVGCYADDDIGINAGSFYYYRRIDNVWQLQSKYMANDANSEDWFGSHLTLTPTHLAVSAYRDDMIGENAGSLYIFKRDGYSYYQIAKITASNATAGDNFGFNNALYEDYVAIGARYQGDLGNNAGAVYVFHMRETPEILSIKDVPYDQGGHVEIKWNASFYDFGRNLSHYSIWRSDEDPNPLPLLFDNVKWRKTEVNDVTQTWGWIADVPGHRFEEYVYNAPTSCDSMAGTDGVHYYMISAHLGDEDFFFDSDAVAGYSVDNLSPPPPTDLVASLLGNQVDLKWEMVQVQDFSHFIVYRNDEILVSTTALSFIDSNLEEGRTYVYKLKAVDVHGNSSEFSDSVTVVTTDVDVIEGRMPENYHLYNNHPNPFNPETEIRFAIPKTSKVIVKIYNTLGREIITLIDSEYAPGTYSVRWNGRDDLGERVPSGIYVYMMEAGDYKTQKKMSLIQ